LEVLVSVVILAMGITAVYQAYLKSLNYLNHIHIRLHATFLLDNRLSEIQNQLITANEIPPHLLSSQERLKIANRDLAITFQSKVSPIKPLSNLFQIDLTLAWVENDRRIKISRSAYLLK